MWDLASDPGAWVREEHHQYVEENDSDWDFGVDE